MERLNTDSFIGKRFHNWTILRLHHITLNKKHNVRHYSFECACKCGKVSPVYLSNLRTRKSKSCINCFTGSKGNRTKHPLYGIWVAMIGRCLRENNRNYPYYGGRGIKVCKRWQGDKGFNNFIKDMGCKPAPNYSIGRINNDGDYKPSNCRWATMLEQAHNKRKSKKRGKK